MGRRLTFIHAADLHIGAPFRGLARVSAAWAHRLYDAIPEAYDRVIDAALNNQVDFVIIAGDVFDTSRASYGDYLHFFEGLRRLDAAGIPAYLVTGNHDPYTTWQKDFDKLPENTTMFGADHATFALYERAGEPLCVLGGRSYYNQTWPDDEDIAEGISRAAAVAALDGAVGDHARARAAAAPFAVGVIHSGLNLDPYKAPADPADLLARGMDYWALGHIHKRQVLPSAQDPRIVFPGCIQGRDIKETGDRGCYLVTLEEGAPNRIEFVPTASVVWEQISVDVEDCATVSDVQRAVVRALFKANGAVRCDEMLVCVTLTGATDLHNLVSRIDVRHDIRRFINETYPTFLCDAIIDATHNVRDEAALRQPGQFCSTLLRVSDDLAANPDDALDFLQKQFIDRGLSVPDNLARRLAEYEQDAKDLVLDLLTEGDGK